MSQKLTKEELAALVVLLRKANTGDGSVRSWTVVIGKAFYTPDDFIIRAPVVVNGEEAGHLRNEDVIDAEALGKTVTLG